MPAKNRTKGIRLSEYFKELKPGDRIALVRNFSVSGTFPKQFSGRTGTVVKKLNKTYEVKFLNGKFYKHLIIKPIHLKRIK
jgi:ribosomal protein L21E